MYFAMARRCDLPRSLEHVHHRHAVPDVAVTAAGSIVALVGALQWVVSVATFTILVYYAITNLLDAAHAAAEKQYPNWIPALGLAVCIVLGASLRPVTIGGGLALLVVGFALRAALHRLRRSPLAIDGA
jgi:APA family basic amino acid/polyamine antiporter